MPRFNRITINGPQFYETVVLPSFGDNIADTDVRNGFFGEFMVMDDVTDSKKIIEITPVGNILKRRDASCKLIPSYVGKADARRLTVTELYGYVEHCAQEFYQGCLKDWRNGDPVFVDRILQFFRKAIREDLISLMYFGDVDRVDDPNARFNTNKFDGIFKKYQQHIASGRVPSGQTFNIAPGAMNAAAAVAAFESMITKQDELLELLGDQEKAFYIDQQWANAYEDYLIATGATNGNAVNYVQDGITTRAYKGIPIFVNKLFRPVLRQITGDAEPHFGILTIRGNFIFGTDRNYGEGPNLDTALKVWYDWDSLQWKYLNVLKAGTEIALPEESVLALPA